MSEAKGCVQFVYADTERNEFVTLGCTMPVERDRARREFEALPHATGTLVCASLLDSDGLVIDTFRVTWETVEASLDEPFAVLLERGRAKNRRDAARLRRELTR